jgi:hypothetical protein
MTQRTPQRYKQTDLTKTIKGARAAGLEVKRVEIDRADGKIVIIIENAATAETEIQAA